MKPTDFNMEIVDSYYALLRSLSPNHKLELIARLSESLKSTSKKNEDTALEDLFGSWELDQSVDQFISELKEDRNFSRKSIDL